jgi:hypothetical protein
MNHAVKTYIGARTGFFGMSDLEGLRASPHFFGRKFPDEVSAPVRLAVLEQLVGWPVLADEAAPGRLRPLATAPSTRPPAIPVQHEAPLRQPATARARAAGSAGTACP